MSPDHEAEESDGHDGVNHRFVAEDWFAREHGEQLRAHPHGRQDRDVNLRMAEEPEEVLPQERRTASVTRELAVDGDQRHEEAGAEVAIHEQENATREKNAEREQAQDSRDEPRPAGQRHAHHGHAFGAHVQRCGDEIQRAHQRADAEDRDADDP